MCHGTAPSTLSEGTNNILTVSMHLSFRYCCSLRATPGVAVWCHVTSGQYSSLDGLRQCMPSYAFALSFHKMVVVLPHRSTARKSFGLELDSVEIARSR